MQQPQTVYGQQPQQFELAKGGYVAQAQPVVTTAKVEQVQAKLQQKPAVGFLPVGQVAVPNTTLDWLKIFLVMCATFAYTVVIYVVLMYIMLNIGQQTYMNIVAGVFFLFYAVYLPIWWRFSSKGAAMAKVLVEDKLREMEEQEKHRQ